MDALPLILAVVLVGEVLWAIRAAHSLSKLYGSRLFESEFFRRLVARNKRVAYVGGGVIAVVIVWSLLAYAWPEFPQIPRPWGTVAIALGLMVLFSGPILDERYVKRVREGTDPNVRERVEP